jgi:hypothetical protein
VFGPHCSHLLVGCKFATGGGSFRDGNSGLLFRREEHRRFVIRAGQSENDTGDVVLRLWRKIARGGERLIGNCSGPIRGGIGLCG